MLAKKPIFSAQMTQFMTFLGLVSSISPRRAIVLFAIKTKIADVTFVAGIVAKVAVQSYSLLCRLHLGSNQTEKLKTAE
jgi:hypothetical protein